MILNLDDRQVDLILGSLQQQPYVHVAGLIQSILNQANSQKDQNANTNCGADEPQSPGSAG